MEEYTFEIRGTVTVKADSYEEAEQSVIDDMEDAFGYDYIDIEVLPTGGDCE